MPTDHLNRRVYSKQNTEQGGRVNDDTGIAGAAYSKRRAATPIAVINHPDGEDALKSSTKLIYSNTLHVLSLKPL
jgi:hypothetical protein